MRNLKALVSFATIAAERASQRTLLEKVLQVLRRILLQLRFGSFCADQGQHIVGENVGISIRAMKMTDEQLNLGPKILNSHILESLDDPSLELLGLIVSNQHGDRKKMSNDVELEASNFIDGASRESHGAWHPKEPRQAP